MDTCGKCRWFGGEFDGLAYEDAAAGDIPHCCACPIPFSIYPEKVEILRTAVYEKTNATQCPAFEEKKDIEPILELKELAPFKPGETFNADFTHMGEDLSPRLMMWFANHETSKMKYMILHDKITGKRVLVKFEEW